jgi:hypothetical protein
LAFRTGLVTFRFVTLPATFPTTIGIPLAK